MISKRFGKLTVLEDKGSDKHRRKLWSCKCECGGSAIVTGMNLRSGHTASCGCLLKKHGMFGTPTYRTWAHFIERCRNPKDKHFKDYGGRGITVCEEWKDFRNFLSDMGVKPTIKHQIDRIDNNGNYTPENCRWVLPIVNSRNSRSSKYWFVDGVKYESLSHAAGDLGVSLKTIKKWCDSDHPSKCNCYSELKYPEVIRDQ